ncbi:unnamed protein product [Schistosoma margrebowiei]|uniref:Uncharacterized protein n=1 Tax=Schistosoma margrebowiei TaxID=48269 RepID=A0A183LC69_9TREM|nr:unnamed protein product [Schistosoma margrebowiei]
MDLDVQLISKLDTQSSKGIYGSTVGDNKPASNWKSMENALRKSSNLIMSHALTRNPERRKKKRVKPRKTLGRESEADI